ncbi:MAG: TIR domain-containing protein [candidate division KSB1 bacterium]|nr:TIR domain-containing protein [candidate division KSB1 bacterium]
MFLSYAREDMGAAKRLYKDLKRFGLNVWLDTESLSPGERWRDEVKDAIEHSNFFIALLSTRSMNKKGFVQEELKTALDVLDLFPDSEKFILPVRLDACEVCNRQLREHQWVDLFPNSEYQNGLKKILQVVSPAAFYLRNEKKLISSVDVNEMIIAHGFYEKNRNPGGTGVKHQYQLQSIRGDKVILDGATGLMSQQSGSYRGMKFSDANHWIKRRNRRSYAGFRNWRMPTLEEAMSLL